MNREKIIMQLLISLNQGNCGYIQDRVRYAIEQYDKLVAEKVIPDTSTSVTRAKNTKKIDGILYEGGNNCVF